MSHWTHVYTRERHENKNTRFWATYAPTQVYEVTLSPIEYKSIHTKFANFIDLYFPHFTTFRINLRMLFNAVVMNFTISIF